MGLRPVKKERNGKAPGRERTRLWITERPGNEMGEISRNAG